MRKGCDLGFSLEKREDCINVCKYLKGRFSYDLVSGAQCEDKKRCTQTETQKVFSEQQETLFTVQVSRRGCIVSSLEIFSSHLGMGLGQRI